MKACKSMRQFAFGKMIQAKEALVIPHISSESHGLVPCLPFFFPSHFFTQRFSLSVRGFLQKGKKRRGEPYQVRLVMWCKQFVHYNYHILQQSRWQFWYPFFGRNTSNGRQTERSVRIITDQKISRKIGVFLSIHVELIWEWRESKISSSLLFNQAKSPKQNAANLQCFIHSIPHHHQHFGWFG